jgi:hypothetical protein
MELRTKRIGSESSGNVVGRKKTVSVEQIGDGKRRERSGEKSAQESAASCSHIHLY